MGRSAVLRVIIYIYQDFMHMKNLKLFVAHDEFLYTNKNYNYYFYN